MDDTERYDKARKHVTVGVRTMMKAGATLSQVEYAVASGIEEFGFTLVVVNINIKDE